MPAAAGLQQVTDKIATLLVLAERQRKGRDMNNRRKTRTNAMRRAYVTQAYKLSRVARNPKLSKKLYEILTYIPSNSIKNAARYLNGNSNQTRNQYGYPYGNRN